MSLSSSKPRSSRPRNSQRIARASGVARAGDQLFRRVPAGVLAAGGQVLRGGGARVRPGEDQLERSARRSRVQRAAGRMLALVSRRTLVTQRVMKTLF